MIFVTEEDTERSFDSNIYSEMISHNSQFVYITSILEVIQKWCVWECDEKWFVFV